jgi:hypothetical protein
MAQNPERVGDIAISNAKEVSRIINDELSNLSEADKKRLIGNRSEIGRFKSTLKKRIKNDVYRGKKPKFIYNIFKHSKNSQATSDVIQFDSLFKTIGNNLKSTQNFETLQENAESIFKTFDVLEIDPVQVGQIFINRMDIPQSASLRGATEPLGALEPQKEQGLEGKVEDVPEPEPEPAPEPEPEPDIELVRQQEELQRRLAVKRTKKKKTTVEQERRAMQQFEGEIPEKIKSIGEYRKNIISYFTGTEYVGPGTPLISYIRNGVKPTDTLDMIALEHDVKYTLATTDAEINEADKVFIRRLNDEFLKEPTVSSFLSGSAMNVKLFIDSLFPTEKLFYDPEANKQLSSNLKGVLRTIENNLVLKQTLNKNTFDEVVTPDLVDRLNQEFPVIQSPELEPEPSASFQGATEPFRALETEEEPLSVLFGEEEDEEFLKRMEQFMKEERLYKRTKQQLDDDVKELINAVKTMSDIDRLDYLGQVSQNDPELFDAYFEAITAEEDDQTGDTPTPTPAPSPRTERQVPSFKEGIERRKGERQRLEDEQRLQRLQQEEHDRRMGMIYENDPDDYMSKPVPNSYMRPMFATQWLDIEKLRQYQTPEYVKAEKEIWSRNWQTPFQFGSGTIDNSVKDIKNLARMEHYLRYALATKGLPKDQRNVAVNFGEPMRRTGRVQKSHHERYDIYKKMNKDMSRFQYNQRVDEPPRTKLFNRDINYKPTELKPSQQRLYDETLNEGLPKLDIKNEYDQAYYMRRIRKDR